MHKRIPEKRWRRRYYAYLGGTIWRHRRKLALVRVGSRCEDCGGTKKLEVHHLTYERLGHELPEDLQVLCKPCHRLKHAKPKTQSQSKRRPKPTPRKAKSMLVNSVTSVSKKKKKLIAENERLHTRQQRVDAARRAREDRDSWTRVRW